MNEALKTFLKIVRSIDPVFVSGKSYDTLGKIYFISRSPGESREEFETRRKGAPTMSDTTEADTANPKNTEGLQIAADMKTAVGHLRAGRATRAEATEVKDAATRAIVDLDVARSIGR